MAIQPIDLQALLAQLDSVAKTQLAHREGLALQQAMQGVQIQRKANEQAKTVHEAQNVGDDGTKVNDEGRKGYGDGKGKGKKDARQNAFNRQEQQPPSVFRDPGLGKNVDMNF
jgi:hypothetical protein